MARIVIADDDKLAHRIYKNILENLGHDFSLCLNGLQAVEAVKQEATDLVILDYMMPEMDGFQACQEIRKLPNGINIPIIIVSANDSSEEILNCLNAGANDFLLKPIKEAILVAKLKNFLKTSSLHKNELDMVKSKVTIADRYKIQKVLGYGAHSVVFQGEDTKNDNAKIAIKLLNQNVVSEDIIESFVETAEKLQKAELDNIVEIIDYGQYNGQIYAVLEFADGGDFATKMKHTEAFTEKELVEILVDISSALVSLEKNDILHLDIKPENILICNGTYKLADFGIIKQESQTIAINSEIWSTASFAPPETFIDQNRVSIKSDIYSLGVTIYEAVTGDNPFAAEKPTVSMYRQINLRPTSLLDLSDGACSVELALLLDMMLSKDPDQRPSPEELKTTTTYLAKCFGEEEGKLLTYLPNSIPTLEEKTPEEELQKTQDVAAAMEKLNEKTSLKVHIGSHTPPTKGSMYKKKPLQTNLITKIAIAAIGFFIIYYATAFVRSFFVPPTPKYDFKGIPAMVMCNNCGHIEQEPVINIKDNKCSKCGGQDWFAFQCMDCKKKFPWDETVHDTSNLENTDEIENIYICPYCKSKNIEQMMTPKQKKSMLGAGTELKK